MQKTEKLTLLFFKLLKLLGVFKGAVSRDLFFPYLL